MRLDNKRPMGPQGWAAPLGVVLLSPLGWVMLPVILFALVILAALGVALLPTVLSIIASFLLRRRLTPPQTWLTIPLLVCLGVATNILIWHAVYQAAR